MTTAEDQAKLNDDTAIFWFNDLGTSGGDYQFLSNFYVGEPLQLNWGFGRESYATGEHAFAAAKADSKGDENYIRLAETPGHAKRAGRRIALRSDWEAVKYDAMAAIIRTKFTLNREEGQKLVDTEDRYLCEGTYWGDETWGVDLNKAYRPGRNWLGTLLMARRAELRTGWTVYTDVYNEVAAARRVSL